MTAEMREQISALCDDELDDREAEILLGQVLEDPALWGEWERIHMISNMMRGEPGTLDASGVAEQVRKRLEDEPPIIAAPRSFNPLRPALHKARHSARAWIMPTAGAALAASLAATAVVMLPGLGEPPAATQGELVALQPMAVTPISNSPRPEAVSVSGAGWKNLPQGSATESKLEAYLVDHSEFGSPMGVARVGPYATLVGYDGKP